MKPIILPPLSLVYDMYSSYLKRLKNPSAVISVILIILFFSAIGPLSMAKNTGDLDTSTYLWAGITTDFLWSSEQPSSNVMSESSW